MAAGGATSPTPQRKRKLGGKSASSTTTSKRQCTTSKENHPLIDLTEGDDSTPPRKKRKGKNAQSKEDEKRLRRFRKAPPASFHDFYDRAVTQRMFVIKRSREPASDCPHGTPDCPSETIDLAGTTGNIYTVTITHMPTCTCPNFAKGNPQCKHIIYCLVKVLKADDDLRYQLAFLTSELRQIFENAGPLPEETVGEDDKDGKRHDVEGDCAICCEDLNAEHEEVVWCKAACGNNLHKTCFQQWAATRKDGMVTCPYCRTPWQRDGDLKLLSKSGQVGADGYVNIANELGIDGKRDYSSYHSFWVQRQARQGVIEPQDYGDWEM